MGSRKAEKWLTCAAIYSDWFLSWNNSFLFLINQGWYFLSALNILRTETRGSGCHWPFKQRWEDRNTQCPSVMIVKCHSNCRKTADRLSVWGSNTSEGGGGGGGGVEPSISFSLTNSWWQCWIKFSQVMPVVRIRWQVPPCLCVLNPLQTHPV